jgi:hypothetical protein
MGAAFAPGQQPQQAPRPAPAQEVIHLQPDPSVKPASAPPPLPAGVKFHVALNGQQAGPFEMPALQQKINSGEILRTTLVWKTGMANWVAAETVAELQALFAHLPPPLPR